MPTRTHDDIKKLRRSVERIRKLSDRAVGLGPFGIGLDGLLAWIPGAGAAYSVGAGGLLILHAVRARARPQTIAKMVAFLTADALTDVVPIPLLPAVADMLFTGHAWAADALLEDLDHTLYYPGTRLEAEADPAFREELIRMAEDRRSGRAPKERRIVYLGEPVGGPLSRSAAAPP